MGAGASLAESFDEANAREMAGDRFDESRFKEVAVDGKISRDQLLQLAAEVVTGASQIVELSIHGDRPATAMPTEALLSEAAKQSAPKPQRQGHEPNVITFEEDHRNLECEVLIENHDAENMASIEDENNARIEETFKQVKEKYEREPTLGFLKQCFDGDGNLLIQELSCNRSAVDTLSFEDWRTGFASIGDVGGDDVGMALMEIEQMILMNEEHAATDEGLTGNELRLMGTTLASDTANSPSTPAVAGNSDDASSQATTVAQTSEQPAQVFENETACESAGAGEGLLVAAEQTAPIHVMPVH